MDGGTNEGHRRLTTCIHVLVTASKNAVCQNRYIGRRVPWSHGQRGRQKGLFSTLEDEAQRARSAHAEIV